MLENFESVFARFCRFAAEKKNRGELHARFGVGRLQRDSLRQKAVRVQDIAILEECLAETRCDMRIIAIELKGVHVFDARFLEIAFFKIGIGALNVALEFGFGRTTSEENRAEDREKYYCSMHVAKLIKRPVSGTRIVRIS